jgi:hypothetical protein
VDGSETISAGSDESVNNIPPVKYLKGVDIITPKFGETESELTSVLAQTKLDLTEAQNEVVSGTSVTQNIINIKKYEKEIKELEKKIIKSKKTQVTVKVTAYFTKNKSGSTQVKEFTYDGSVLNL